MADTGATAGRTDGRGGAASMAGPHSRAADGPAIGRTTTATMLLVVAAGRGAFSSGPLNGGAEAGDGRGGGANGVTVV